MIQENQKLLNQINVISDGLIVFCMLPLAYVIRFGLFPHDVSSLPLSAYIPLDLFYTPFQLFTFALLGVYRSYRVNPLRAEVGRIFAGIAADILVLVSLLYLFQAMYYSRLTLAFFCALTMGALWVKRYILRRGLRWMRSRDLNQKHVLILGGGDMARRYLREIRSSQDYGYRAMGYMADKRAEDMFGLTYLGDLSAMGGVLERYRPDEVVSAIDMDEFHHMDRIVEECEKAGVRLAIIPFFADYIPPHPQFDYLNGLPLMNVRYIPLDNWGNAFMKRAMDVVGSALLLVLTAPLMLFCAIGVRLSSPGPIIFKQKRIGQNKEPFYMYKFRSMYVNAAEDTAWTGVTDDRRTPFGMFIRKFSLDELPQFWNVLKGDMSLVGPRPEIPYYVDQFKGEVPLYMVKHQVRPGITGWAQIHGLRGDTSIRERVEYDVYYIEHWSLLLDIKILLLTLFRGKFINEEKL